jgi:competence protein ComGC
MKRNSGPLGKLYLRKTKRKLGVNFFSIVEWMILITVILGVIKPLVVPNIYKERASKKL